ncbi:MAG: alkyl hydroperoxide reductase subunit F [Proteobacteria bacterium]|nr:alkyl hydroperoxide reductase subunit F [Pseudomonadota bacterium]
MITKEILQTLKSYTENMQRPVTFVLQTGEHEKREALREFLSAVCSVSDALQLEERDLGARSAITFSLESDGQPTGISFSGIPGGHEFNSLVLAMLQASGTEIRMDDSLKALIASVGDRLHFEVFVSLSCHNCPDVVQALNQFALLNENISTEMIDGGLFQDVVKARDIQGVPSVYVNGELFANGKVDAAQLVDKLLERYPSTAGEVSFDALPMQDVTVIGGGPAGVSAAIYAARKGLKVTVVADRVGGQVKDTMGIENLISVPETTGPALSADLLAHMRAYEITLKEHLRVTDIETGTVKTITLSSGEQIQTRSIVIATGARWRELGVPGEKENIGNGVAYCPHCDGPFFKGKDVAVIGGGNSGIEAALDLAGIVSSVTVFEFLPDLKADQVLVSKAEATGNIRILKNVATRRITATNGKVDGIEYEDRESGEVYSQALSGVFVQIGLVPNSQFLVGVVDLTRHGEVQINDRCQTSAEGIFACGDVTTVPYKQIVISMGEGAKAGLAAFEYLLMNPLEEPAEDQDSLAA